MCQQKKLVDAKKHARYAARMTNLASIIAATGKPKTQIASEAGITRQTIHNIITGKRQPGIRAVIGLCRALNMRPEDLRPELGDTK